MQLGQSTEGSGTALETRIDRSRCSKKSILRVDGFVTAITIMIPSSVAEHLGAAQQSLHSRASIASRSGNT
jgi:hypothetical protein